MLSIHQLRREVGKDKRVPLAFNQHGFQSKQDFTLSLKIRFMVARGDYNPITTPYVLDKIH